VDATNWAEVHRQQGTSWWIWELAGIVAAGATSAAIIAPPSYDPSLWNVTVDDWTLAGLLEFFRERRPMIRITCGRDVSAPAELSFCRWRAESQGGWTNLAWNPTPRFRHEDIVRDVTEVLKRLTLRLQPPES
jgi:hypothetical protein